MKISISIDDIHIGDTQINNSANDIHVNDVTCTVRVSHEIFEQLMAREDAYDIFEQLASALGIKDISKFSIVDKTDDCESSHTDHY